MLEFVATRNEGATLSEIAAALDAPVSSIRDLLAGLVSTGFLDRIRTRYVLGPLPYLLHLHAGQPSAASIRHDDLEALLSELEALSDEPGFTVLLTVRVGDELVFVDEAGGHPLLEHWARLRLRIGLLHSAQGKVILAALDDEELRLYLRRQSEEELAASFSREREEIRRTGVIVDEVHGIVPRVNHPRSDTTVVTTAVRDRSGRPIASVSVGHDPEFFARNLDKIFDILLRHASQWEDRLSRE